MKINYKKLLLGVFIIAVAAFFLMLSPETSESRIVTNVNPDISSDQLKAIVVEDFENTGDEANWRLESIPVMLKNPKNPDDNPVVVLEHKFIKGSPADLVPEKWAANNKGLKADVCLGVHFQFKYPGYNSVHIIPKEPIPLPGRAKGISLWFHARGHAYKLECWVEDYKGQVHILKFGSVNFVGWRPLKVYIPIHIPQKIESYPQTRWLKIKRFVIRADADAMIVPVYMFLDQIKVLTDDYEVFFDGSKLHESFGKNKETGKNK